MLLKQIVFASLFHSAYAQLCSFSAWTPLTGVNGLSMRHFIDPDADTLTMELTYEGIGWVGVAFSEDGTMNGASPAILGVPGADTEVGFYTLGSSAAAGPVALNPNANPNRLIDASVKQDMSTTTLTFTLPTTENWETLVTAGSPTRLIYAVGGSNTLGQHSQRASSEITFENCVLPELDCSLTGEIDVLGGNIAVSGVINPQDDTLTMQVVYDGIGWVGVGFSDGGTMQGSNPVVIGLPDAADNAVGFYSLGSSTAPNPVLTSTNNLINPSIDQTETETILSFTMPNTQGSNTVAVAGEPTRIIFAYGFGNALSTHANRGSAEITLGECRAIGATLAPTPVPPPTSSPSAAPTTASGILPVLSSTALLTVDEAAGTMTAVITYDGLGWVGFGASPEGSMIGSEVIIGIPGEPQGINNPAKYTISARQRSGVQIRPEAEQTLIDASIVQTDTQTILTYTKLLSEAGELEILANQANNFVYAAGVGNALDNTAHKERAALLGVEFGSADFAQGAQPKRKMWVAHGFFMAFAWGLFVPLAVGSSMLRDLLPLPAGAWFKLHFFFNSMAIVFTIIGFSLAVAAINDEQGDSATHFDTINHRKFGLAIFILAIFQAGVAAFRPHPPSPPPKKDTTDKGDEEDGGNEPEEQEEHAAKKSTIRFLWECKHRIFGLGLLAISWYNVDSGLGVYAERFGDDVTGAFWGITGTLACLIAAGYAYSKATAKNDD